MINLLTGSGPDPVAPLDVTVDPVSYSLPLWHAVSVYPRHEKKVAQLLDARQMTYFLPLYRGLRQWKDRRKHVEMVLFPGYLFVNISQKDRLSVQMLPGFARFVCFQGRPAVVPEHEIRAISRGTCSGIDVQPHPYLRKGQRVRVIAGSLMGIEGILVRRNGQCRLVLSVDSMMRSIALEVDEFDVVPC